MPLFSVRINSPAWCSINIEFGEDVVTEGKSSYTVCCQCPIQEHCKHERDAHFKNALEQIRIADMAH